MTTKILIVFLVSVIVGIYAQGLFELCGDNEVMNNCGRMCEPTCNNPNPIPKRCPRIQCTRATRRCRCIPGYLRDENDRCVLQQDCFTQKYYNTNENNIGYN